MIKKTPRLIAFVALFALAGAGQVQAQITTLASFNGSGGYNPDYGSLVLSGGTLYGTTAYTNTGAGEIFSEPVTGGTPTVLADLGTGQYAYGSVILNGSTLYGMGSGGGLYGDGVVYSVPTIGGTPTILANFNGENGQAPKGSLILSGSTLYGMTYFGGINGKGEVFSVPVTGGTPTVLFSFDGTHGAQPYGSLVLSGSTLYGTTSSGGASNDGVVFSLPVIGGTPTVLATFTGNSTGTQPTGSLLLSGSTLYGTALTGGISNNGVVFSLSVTGASTPTILGAFTGADGGNPQGSLILSGGTLYGTTTSGGASSDGVVFSLPVTGGTPDALDSFSGLNGENPEGDLVLSGGTLYGTTSGGGIGSGGTIFSVPVPEPGSVALLAGGILGLATVRRRS